jgi:predicted amidohydrolase
MPKSITEGLFWLDKLVQDAASQQAAIICFPESFIPGYPTFEVEERSPEKLQHALNKACEIAAANKIAIILPMDWYSHEGLQNIAHVISADGEVLGYQTKNQLDPSEDNTWIPGTERSLFEVDGVKFGITICHEGFRYPESVRWSAQRGAQIVFHPNCTGSDTEEWNEPDSPYYEKAIMMRAMENTIFFAASNYAFKYPHSASLLIAPNGRRVAAQPYSEPGVLVTEIDLEEATGLLAKRFKNIL